MRIIRKKPIIEFYKKYNQSEQPLKSWLEEAKKASWKTPQDIKDDYKKVSFLSDNRVVFDIKGNHFRLVVKINYNCGVVYIKFLGTHAEYDKIDAETVNAY